MKKSSMYYFTFVLLFTQLGLFTKVFAAEPAFEAYYKFILGGQHSGYVVQRFEIDDKKKEMTSMYYVFVKTPSVQTTESLVAKADLSFEPISYQYSAIVNGKAKFADATFKYKKMTGKMLDGTKKQNVTLTVPPQGFLSTFLNFILLKNGLMVNKRYEYRALTEESPACMAGDATCKPSENGFVTGTAHIKSETVYKNIPAYLVEFVFKGIKFEGYLSQKGETLGSVSPLQDAATEIVATRAEAVGPFTFNEKHIRLVFNDIPQGIKNPLHAPKPTPSLPPMPVKTAADKLPEKQKGQ